MSQGSGLGRPGSPPLSPISETPPSPPTPPSVSAAVSDESVAGDSGVFEASNKSSQRTLSDMNLETAQVQIKLRQVFKLVIDFTSLVKEVYLLTD